MGVDHYMLCQFNLILEAKSHVSNYCTVTSTTFLGIGLNPKCVSCLCNWVLAHLPVYFHRILAFLPLTLWHQFWPSRSIPKATCSRSSQAILLAKMHACVIIYLGLPGSQSQGPAVSGVRCLHSPYTQWCLQIYVGLRKPLQTCQMDASLQWGLCLRKKIERTDWLNA